MAQPATNPKIEELRFRLKSDPKSRLFFPLAEELRKSGQFGEAEQVLRSGLSVHATYLSAWVSLGRVLRDQQKDGEAVEALAKALQLDPGNVVAARLLADAYLAVGEKLEALKKYKLVHALLPGDEELEGTITRLERDLNPPAPAPVVEEPPARVEEEAAPFGDDEAPLGEVLPFSDAVAAQEREQSIEEATADVEPMSAAHAESPFEEPVASYTSAAVAVEDVGGFHVERAPLAAEVPTPVMEEFLPPVESAPITPEPIVPPPAVDESDVFAPADADVFATSSTPAVEPFVLEETPVGTAHTDVTDTLTMADLYTRQGLVDEARHIYEHILARDPDNATVRARLDALTPQPAAAPAEPALDANRRKIARLEQWLARVTGDREGGRV